MKTGGGHAKGASFERKVCMILSRWIDPDTEETLFWRAAMSGGRATVRAKRKITDSTQAGDISCVHSSGEWLTKAFVLECKHYKNLDIKSGILSGKGNLAQFWREVSALAKKHGKEPLLIAKENRTDTLLITTPKGLSIAKLLGPPLHSAWLPLATSQMLGKSSAIIFAFDEVFAASKKKRSVRLVRKSKAA